MERIWLEQYPEGVPAEINPDAYQSLVEIFNKSCDRYRNKPAFACMGTLLTYDELDELSLAFAVYLQMQLKLTKGDRIAIMMPNLLQYPVAMFGALRAGLVVVNVNPLYTPRELAYQLADSGARAVVVLANFAQGLQQALPETAVQYVIVTEIGDLYSWVKSRLVNWVVKYVKKMVPSWDIPHAIKLTEALQWGRKNPSWQEPAILKEDVAFLQYTGSTTGIAKGAVLTHRNMVANLEQTSAWIHPFIEDGREIIITALPLYHIFSLNANCLTFLKIGALNVLITNPRDIKGFVRELSHYPFTAITGVNTLFNALLNNPDFVKLDFSRLHLALGGGMAVQKAVAMRWHEITGKPLLEAYGLTETSPAVTINPLNLVEYNGSIGLPVPSTQVTIRDDAGDVLGDGVAGELCVKGPQVMREYWQKPGETQAAFFPDGWLRTGDVAVMDEKGFFRIVERKKDMILVSGFNVYPHEIEEVLLSHPEVLEAAVVGGPGTVGGESVLAFVVSKDPTLDEAALREYCRQQLTAYKVPKHIIFRQELPKSNIGKILRRALREEVNANKALIS